MTDVQTVALEIMKARGWFRSDDDMFVEFTTIATGMAQEFLDITSDPNILGDPDGE